MTESADLARQVASQLGGDLDRILGSLPGDDAPEKTSPQSPSGQKAEVANKPLLLSQIAGLGSGQKALLTPGLYDIGPTTSPPGMPGSQDPRMVPFRLHVAPDHSVTLTTLTHSVSVDGRQVSGGMRISAGYIDAFAARFVLGPNVSGQKPPSSSAQIAAQMVPKKIPVSEIRGVSIDHKARRRNKRNRQAEDFPELTQAVSEAQVQEIRRLRTLNPDTCELLRRAKLGRSHIWNVNRSDAQFGKTTLAYGEVGWTPPYDRPDKIRNEAAFAVNEFLELPSVPLTLDLQQNGLGIVGPRESALAVARQIGISFCTLSSPEDIELAVMASPATAADWQWAEQLPHAQPGEIGSMAMPVLLIDGLEQVGANELRALLAENSNLGAIVIESQLGDLPSICGTVMELRPDGSSAIMDFRRGKTINSRATPVGMSVNVALDAARAIAGAATGQTRQPRREIAVPDHIKRPDSPKALPQRRR